MKFSFSDPAYVKNFDAFAKPLQDFRIQTVSGAIVSLTSGILILILILLETRVYFSPHLRQEIYVDIARDQRMTIILNITFNYLPCELLNVDSMDVSGEHQIDIDHEIFKMSVDNNGTAITGHIRDEVNKARNETNKAEKGPNYCGSCYGAESSNIKCCNTCDSVQAAYNVKGWAVLDVTVFSQCRDENWSANLKNIGSRGCRFYGKLKVNKVAGTFHIAPGKSYTRGEFHAHDLKNYGNVKFNMSHTITNLGFGDSYPGMEQPLNGMVSILDKHSPLVNYYVKLVPTTFVDLNGNTLETNQYSVTWHQRPSPLSGGSSGIPGVFFNYEISPMLVRITEERVPLGEFLVNLCAIVGGVFTVASLVDAFLYRSVCLIRKKL